MTDENFDRSAMEHIAPPQPLSPSPDGATSAPRDKFNKDNDFRIKTIEGAARQFEGSCLGGDAYANNCAHFLSDAFLRAGFSELQAPADCINARCGTSAKRPIRAREMWCWFKEMAVESRTTLPRNEGFWAVFQLDESAYWGGHVLIFDSDNNDYYGTGHYPYWDQYCYKW